MEDKVPPARSGGSPTGILSPTTSVKLLLYTHENATCKYSTSAGIPYDLMPVTLFTNAKGKTHTRILTGLLAGNMYHYYIKCKDNAGNINLIDYQINFSIAQPLSKPNILIIMTDDQDYNSLTAKRPDGTPIMPNVKDLLMEEGTTFSKFFATSSICCPSRAGLLTGQYAHNNGILGNHLPGGGYLKFRKNQNETLPVWLQRAGYHTGFIGKYLNQYGFPVDGVSKCREIPPGWNDWQASIDDSGYRYYDFALNENGRIVAYSNPESRTPTDIRIWSCVDNDPTTPLPPFDEYKPREYQTYVYTNKAIDYIRNQSTDSQPFFLWLNYFAPHESASLNDMPPVHPVPAPEDIGVFSNLPLPQPPSFNETDVSDKPWFVQNKPLFDSEDIAFITEEYRGRYESLLSVDRGIAQIVNTLKETGQYNNTIIIFLSDNGYVHGEHRLRKGKNYAYEESTHVPLIIVGPGIQKGLSIDKLTANIDLAPTILELGNATSSERTIDGSSLVPLMNNPYLPWRSAILFEHDGVFTGNPSTALRIPGCVYVEYADNITRELYDLRADPFQLNSLHRNTSWVAKMKPLLDTLRNCSGISGEKSCWY